MKWHFCCFLIQYPHLLGLKMASKLIYVDSKKIFRSLPDPNFSEGFSWLLRKNWYVQTLWRHLELWPCFRRILGKKVYVWYWSGFMQGSKENKQLMRQKKVYIQCSNVCIMGLKLYWSRIWCCGRSAGISNILVGSTVSSRTRWVSCPLVLVRVLVHLHFNLVLAPFQVG